MSLNPDTLLGLVFLLCISIPYTRNHTGFARWEVQRACVGTLKHTHHIHAHSSACPQSLFLDFSFTVCKTPLCISFMNWALLFYSQHYLHLLQSHIMATDSLFYSLGTWVPGGSRFTEEWPVNWAQVLEKHSSQKCINFCSYLLSSFTLTSTPKKKSSGFYGLLGLSSF